MTKESSVGAFILSLQHEDARVRWDAAEALGKVADPSTSIHLFVATFDWSVNVRDAAVRALKAIRIRDPIATSLVAQVTDKRAVIGILERTADVAAVRALSKMLQAIDWEDHGWVWEDTETRCSAARALGTIGSEHAKDALALALEQFDSPLISSPSWDTKVRRAIETALKAAERGDGAA